MADVRDFEADRGYAEAEADSEWFDRVYRSVFTDVAAVVRVKGKCRAQTRGVDTLIYTEHDKIYRVDEKIRRKDYGDFLLEAKHVYENGDEQPGWIAKPLSIDYIAYAVPSERRCWLWPWPLLSRAWESHRDQWVARAKVKEGGFSFSSSPNPGYVTWNVCVPRGDLFAALADASFVDGISGAADGLG